jgi:hypothetical protein
MFSGADIALLAQVKTIGNRIPAMQYITSFISSIPCDVVAV